MRYLFKRNPFQKTVESILALRAKNEILIRYRVPGRFKLLVPPLLYVGNASYRLRNEVEKLPGVSGLEIDDQLGTVTLEYDESTISEKELFLTLDSILTPMLAKSTDDNFGELMMKQRWKRIKSAAFQVGVLVTTIYIVYIHARLLIRWIFNPFYYWAPLAAVIFLIWAHRGATRRGLGMSPA